MTTYSTTTTPAFDGTGLHTNIWTPDGDPAGAVVIAHGMAEHAVRYAPLAEELAQAGFAVYAHDHRGHGRTASSMTDLGFFADHDGWAKVVGDLGTVVRRAHVEHPGIPVVLLGHSMGSLLARSFALDHSQDIDALVLSGTAGDPGVLGKVGLALARVEARLLGRRHPSRLLNTLSFGSFNKRFAPNRTEFDWLSRNEATVDAYIADPFCGVVPSAQFFVDMLGGVHSINDDASVGRVRDDLPILLVAGGNDPVGDDGRGVTAVRDQFARSGVRDLTLKLYPGARHEIFNETNADEVIGDVVAWVEEHTTR